MRIDDVNKAVTGFQQLAQESTEAATQSRDELFSLLLKRDKFYVVPIKPQVDGAVLMPTMEPVWEGATQEYLRVFTHQELASKLGTPVKITALELCRLSKHWFLRGIPGLIVNDGAAWFMMPLDTILTLFSEMVGGPAPDAADAEVITLYHAIRQCGDVCPFYRDGVFVHPVKGQGNGWELARMEHLTEATGDITMPSGISVPGERVRCIADYLSGLEWDAQDYDSSDLALIPSPEKEEPAPTPKKKAKVAPPEWLKKIKPSNLLKAGKGELKRLLPVCAGVLAVLGLFLLVFAVCISRSATPKLVRALRNGDYQEARAIYFKIPDSRRLQPNEVLADWAMTLVQQYADGDITEPELSAHLSALHEFPAVAEDVATAADVATQLSASKEAYAKGLEATDVSGKLQAWEDVIGADTASWVPVHKDVSSNESAYVGAVVAEAQEYVDCGLYGHAYALSNTLSYWYPWSIKANTLTNELSKYANYENIAVPVEIQTVKTSIPSLDNDVDLFISWKNLSGKSIKEINFFVTPMDDFGNEVTKPFCAVDTKGYKPGEGPTSDTWGWAKAWRNGSIKSAVVTRVAVTFEGGATKEFSL